MLAGVLLSRDADDKRHACGDFPVRALVPSAVLAELIAVVAPEDDQGVFAQAEAVELGDDAADLGVGVADAREIAVNGLALYLVGDRPVFGNALVATELAGFVAGERRGAIGQLLERGETDVCVLGHVPVLFGSDPGHVWLVETDGDEERF